MAIPIPPVVGLEEALQTLDVEGGGLERVARRAHGVRVDVRLQGCQLRLPARAQVHDCQVQPDQAHQLTALTQLMGGGRYNAVH